MDNQARLSLVCRIGLLLGMLLFSSSTYAVMAEDLTIGNAKALSLGNAVTADPPGIDSIHFNPAGLARMKGRQYEAKFIAGTYSLIMHLGDYSDTRKAVLQSFQNATNFPASYWYDIAYESTSKTQGVSVMLPGFGLVNMNTLMGLMGGATYSPPGSRLTFGTNVYSPMMVGFYRKNTDPGKWIGQRFSVTLLTYFSPTVAYQVTDNFSIGASVSFNYAGAGIDLPFHSPSLMLLYLGGFQNQICPQLPNSFLCASAMPLYDNWGTISIRVQDPLTFGFNAGWLWDVTPWLTLGMSYNSPIKMDMKGHYTWPYSKNFVNFIRGVNSGFNGHLGPDLNSLVSIFGYQFPTGQSGVSGSKGQINMEFPEHISLGFSLNLTPLIKINGDYKYTQWSVWKYLTLQLDQPSDLMRLTQILQPGLATASSASFPLRLKDTWNWAFGLEYQLTNRLALRFGIEDRPTSVTNGNQSPLFPLGSYKLYGAGFGYRTNTGGQFDFSLGYMHTAVDMPPNSSHVGNNESFNEVIYNPYPGQYIKTDLTSYLLEMSYQQQF